MAKDQTAADNAFRNLLAALEAEIAELRQVGSHHFHHDGAPRESQGLLRRANERGLLQNAIAHLHEQWLQITPVSPASTSPSPDVEPENPILIRHIKGISAREAARRLGTSEAKVRAWLEAGTLKGYRPTGGQWKITPPDLMMFARDHRDLF